MPPAKRSRDWLEVWRAAQSQGMTRQAMSKSLDIKPGRLNDLILGRARPTAKERAAMDSKRRATRVFWEDSSGNTFSFYTGRGRSFREMVNAGDLDTIAEEQSKSSGVGFAKIVGSKSGWIGRGGTRIYPQGGKR